MKKSIYYIKAILWVYICTIILVTQLPLYFTGLNLKMVSFNVIPFRFVFEMTDILSTIRSTDLFQKYLFSVIFDKSKGFVLNIIMFVPLGLLLLMINKKRSAISVLVLSFTLSAIIELTQLLTMVLGIARSGRCADIDDIIANSLGGLLGYLGYRLIRKIVYGQRNKESKTQGAI